MAKVVVRPWTQADTEATVRLRSAADPTLPEGFFRSSLTNPLWHALTRQVAELDDEFVGYASLSRYEDEPDLIAFVAVDEHARGHGLARALFATLLAVPEGRRRSWIIDAVTGDGVEVARHWGFVEFSRSVFSRLDLPGPPQGGGSAADLEVLSSEDVVERGLVDEVDDALRRSSTHPEAASMGWVETFTTGSEVPGVLWALARLDGELVGVAFARPTDDDVWMVDFTGVVPEARGRGVARDLKVALHQAAVARGARSMLTANEAGNDGIRALNRSLGYVPVATRVRLRRPASD